MRAPTESRCSKATRHTVYLLQGELRLRMGDSDLHATAGDCLLAPKGTPHTYLVVSRDGARFLTILRGAGFEGLVREISRPAERKALPTPSGPPTPEDADALARVCLKHGIEVVGRPLG